MKKLEGGHAIAILLSDDRCLNVAKLTPFRTEIRHLSRCDSTLSSRYRPREGVAVARFPLKDFIISTI